MSIGIVGMGYVGTGMAKLFGTKVRGFYDPQKPEWLQFGTDECDQWSKNSKGAVNACDLAIICVPTPDMGGKCDTSIVEETVEWVKTPLILIKSTVPPFTTGRLSWKYDKSVCFSPEYLGEGGYFVPYWKYPDPHDAKKHSFFIVGGEKSHTRAIVDIFSRVMGPHVTYMQTDLETAEFVKYMENVWIATKVIWAAQMADAAEALGVDYRVARELWALDARVDKMHTLSWPESKGFGGKCIPKDLNAFIAVCEEEGFDPQLLKKVREINAGYQAK